MGDAAGDTLALEDLLRQRHRCRRWLVEHGRWASIDIEKDVENLRFRENHICFSDFILDPPFVPLNMVFDPQKLSMFYHFWWYLIYVFKPKYGYKQMLGISQVITNINEPC